MFIGTACTYIKCTWKASLEKNIYIIFENYIVKNKLFFTFLRKMPTISFILITLWIILEASLNNFGHSSEKTFKGTVVDRTLSFLLGESLEITFTVPLTITRIRGFLIKELRTCQMWLTGGFQPITPYFYISLYQNNVQLLFFRTISLVQRKHFYTFSIQYFKEILNIFFHLVRS